MKKQEESVLTVNTMEAIKKPEINEGINFINKKLNTSKKDENNWQNVHYNHYNVRCNRQRDVNFKLRNIYENLETEDICEDDINVETEDICEDDINVETEDICEDDINVETEDICEDDINVETEEKNYLIRTLLEKLENCRSEFPNKDQLDSFCCEINKKCEDDVKTRSANISTNISNVSSNYVTLSALSETNEISRVSSSIIQANYSKSPINSSFISNGNDSTNDIRMVNESIISAINTSINKTPVEEQIINYRKYRHNNYINERTNSDSVTRIQTNEHINNK